MEASLFDQALREAEAGADPASVQAQAWVDPSKGLKKIALYGARIQRTIDRDSAKLAELQAGRQAAYAKAQEESILLCKLNFASRIGASHHPRQPPRTGPRPLRHRIDLRSAPVA